MSRIGKWTRPPCWRIAPSSSWGPEADENRRQDQAAPPVPCRALRGQRNDAHGASTPHTKRHAPAAFVNADCRIGPTTEARQIARRPASRRPRNRTPKIASRASPFTPALHSVEASIASSARAMASGVPTCIQMPSSRTPNSRSASSARSKMRLRENAPSGVFSNSSGFMMPAPA